MLTKPIYTQHRHNHHYTCYPARKMSSKAKDNISLVPWSPLSKGINKFSINVVKISLSRNIIFLPKYPHTVQKFRVPKCWLLLEIMTHKILSSRQPTIRTLVTRQIQQWSEYRLKSKPSWANRWQVRQDQPGGPLSCHATYSAKPYNITPSNGLPF